MAGTVICDYINSANVSGGFLGIGQTWQDVTASRTNGATYTNTTGKPIIVYLAINGTSTTACQLRVNGSNCDCGNTNDSDWSLGLNAVVPTDGTYFLHFTGSLSILKWAELR